MSNIIQKLKKQGESSFSVVDVPFTFEGDSEPTVLSFRVRSISLGELMSAMKGYPRLYALIEGAREAEALESLSLVEQVQKASEFIGAFEALVCLAAELRVEDGSFLSFSMDGDLKPQDLPSEVVIAVGQGIVGRFRIAVK